jgi:hypothetical protein
MTGVFIVRPFGKKPVPVKGADGSETSVQVDFDAVDERLIQPALARNQLTGVTTGVIARAGNIREDMFQMLIASDLVIADISIDNANVFYELGIRHGLRPGGTILIRFPTAGKDVPFDLKTDRYIAYEREDPAAAVELLAQAIRETIRAIRSAERKPDSPVFLLLPKLVPPNPASLVVIPREFREAIEKAAADEARGRTTLALLGEEAKRNAWAREGLRLVGAAQRRMKAFEAARESWEFIRKDLQDDVEANLQLATIYQRLGDAVTASQACRRVLDNPAADRKAHADARSQLARNEKAAWVADFGSAEDERARRQRAIADNRLIEAFDGYLAGFSEDLNDYYSGINALGLLAVIVTLAQEEPDAWAGLFPTAKKAQAALDDYNEQLALLRAAVRVSLDNAARRAERSGRPDEWLPPSEAQYTLLTASNPAFVRNAYKTANNAGGSGFSVDSEAAQVAIFSRLGLLRDNCREALAALEAPPPGQPAAQKRRDRVIVATGHRADAPGRQTPRFPNTPASIAKATAWLREAIEAEKAATEGTVSGIGGAASGTDLLFHEVCMELAVRTAVVLPIPIEDYRRESVADGGAEWIERFNRLVEKNPPIVLSDSAELPVWAQGIPGYNVFQRGNIWVMEDALLRENADVTLLALWNGKAGDGPGGTADMVELARSHGAKVCIKDTNQLFELGG